MHPDRQLLTALLERLRELELRVPPAHEAAICEVARAALATEIRIICERLAARETARRPRRAPAS